MIKFFKCFRIRSNFRTFSSFTSMVPDPSTSNKSKASLISCFWVSFNSIFAAFFFHWSELGLDACNKYTCGWKINCVTGRSTRTRINELSIINIVKHPIPYNEPQEFSPFPLLTFMLLVINIYLAGKPGSFLHLGVFFQLSALWEAEKAKKTCQNSICYMGKNWPYLVYPNSSV